MGWIIAFAFVAAIVYTLLSLPDYVLKMWYGNRSIVRAATARLKAARARFSELQEIANDYPQDHEIQVEISDVVEQVRHAANPAIANIQTMRNSALWNLPMRENSSWWLGTPQFWRYWRPIWKMRQNARLIERQVAETERYVQVLNALCVQLQDAAIAFMPNLPDDDEAEPPADLPEQVEQLDESEQSDDQYSADELEEIATAFKFSIRQESIAPLLGQIEGERSQNMRIPHLYEQGLQLQQTLDDLEETAWQEESPDREMVDSWLTQLEEWREEKVALANEVEYIQRRRVEHERNVRKVETKVDEYVVRQGESDLSEFAYDLLAFSDRRLEMLDWENAAEALQIATDLTNGLANMQAIDQNANALKQRIAQSAGATRAKLSRAVARYTEWRTLFDHAVKEREDVDQWLRGVRTDVTKALAEKSDIIQLLNNAVLAQKAVQEDDATVPAVAEVWRLWDEIDEFVTLDDHWLSEALRQMPSEAREIPADATMRTQIRNWAQKVGQALEEVSADVQAWQTMIQQDETSFARTRNQILEPAVRWGCLQQGVARIEELMATYQKTYQKPQLGWLADKYEELEAARQAAIEKIRQKTGRIQTLYDTLQSEADRIQVHLRDVGEEEATRTITAQLRKAQQERDVADARMALQSAKYALEA